MRDDDFYRLEEQVGRMARELSNVKARLAALEQDDRDRRSKNREAEHRFIEELRGMSSGEILESAVRVGIYDKDGNLTPEFGGSVPPSSTGEK